MRNLLIIIGALLLLATLPICAQDASLNIPNDSLNFQDNSPILEDSLNIQEDSLIDSVVVNLLVDEMPNAIVHQDSAIRQLMMDKFLGRVRGEITENGFRVQVYSSNQQQTAKNEALILQQQLQEQLDQPVYAISEPPFWKVRIGNFLSREEAVAYSTELISQRPDLQGSTYIVPDKVIIIK